MGCILWCSALCGTFFTCLDCGAVADSLRNARWIFSRAFIDMMDSLSPLARGEKRKGTSRDHGQTMTHHRGHGKGIITRKTDRLECSAD